MKFIKRGRIWKPDTSLWWQQLYGILPTPIHLQEAGVIRVFFATTCKDRLGRMTYIDVSEDDPTQIVSEPKQIIVDIGRQGSFDEHGLNPSNIEKIGDVFYMYYAGYQRYNSSRYSIHSGILKSHDLIHFDRISDKSIFDNSAKMPLLRSAPTVTKLHDNTFLMCYVSDTGWEYLDSSLYGGRLMPNYHLCFAKSVDGLNWVISESSIETRDREFGLGRPYFFMLGNRFLLFYSIRHKDVLYRLGYAESLDGQTWIRKDDITGIDISSHGWDSEMICYPAVITVKGKTYLFYNGNNNGETGFGVAELSEP